VTLAAESVALTQATVDVSQGGLVAALARQGAPDGTIRLQCDPPAIEQHLIQHLPEEFELDPRSFQYVLYVLELDDEPQVCVWWSGMLRMHAKALAFSVRPWQDVMTSGMVGTCRCGTFTRWCRRKISGEWQQSARRLMTGTNYVVAMSRLPGCLATTCTDMHE
jgi:hypothetical protein